MHWAVAAPFITERTDCGWLTPFVPAGRHQFTLVPTPLRHQDWHYRASRTTGKDEWKDFWRQAGAAIEASEGGIIAVFPQLAATIGLRQRLGFSHRPTVAWSF